MLIIIIINVKGVLNCCDYQIFFFFFEKYSRPLTAKEECVVQGHKYSHGVLILVIE